MDIIQTFYDSMAADYDKLFLDWNATVREQAQILERIFQKEGFDRSASVLDCACGIGTQSIGLAEFGYAVTASDLSTAELQQAKAHAAEVQVAIRFEQADFCKLSRVFSEKFQIVICIDNALPHMQTHEALGEAIASIVDRLEDGGILVASIRDYDAMLQEKPPYSPPYIHQTEKGKRVSFQTWDWEGDIYKLTQYIITDEDTLHISKFDCVYRAARRQELTDLLTARGCKVTWLFPEDTGFYQPIVVAKK